MVEGEEILLFDLMLMLRYLFGFRSVDLQYLGSGRIFGITFLPCSALGKVNLHNRWWWWFLCL
jgi:hypothetical protein